jgi:hypothetical protein
MLPIFAEDRIIAMVSGRDRNPRPCAIKACVSSSKKRTASLGEKVRSIAIRHSAFSFSNVARDGDSRPSHLTRQTVGFLLWEGFGYSIDIHHQSD